MAQRLLRQLGRRTTPTATAGLLSYLCQTSNNIIDSSVPLVQSQSRRTYISEMRKSAFEGNILRLLRNDIQYELDRSPSASDFGSISEHNQFTVDERPGEQWIRLTKKFKENEDIKVEATMFDGSVPNKKNGGIATGDDVQLHITMIVDIFKGKGSDVLEFVCSAWPDTLEIHKVYLRQNDRTGGQPYMGPEFRELDDELQISLYNFLLERGIDDDFARDLHVYMHRKDKSEFIRWMGSIKSFIEKT